ELELLRENDDVGGLRELPCFVRPEAAGRSPPRLHFVHDEGDAVLGGHLAESLEERRARVPITSLGLDRLDDDAPDLARVSPQNGRERLKRTRLRLAVFLDMLRQREVRGGKRHDGPWERRDVELVDGLAPRERERP